MEVKRNLHPSCTRRKHYHSSKQKKSEPRLYLFDLIYKNTRKCFLFYIETNTELMN